MNNLQNLILRPTDNQLLNQLAVQAMAPMMLAIQKSANPAYMAFWNSIKHLDALTQTKVLISQQGNERFGTQFATANERIANFNKCLKTGGLFIVVQDDKIVGHMGYDIREGAALNITQHEPEKKVGVVCVMGVSDANVGLELIECVLSHARRENGLIRIAHTINTTDPLHINQLIPTREMGFYNTTNAHGVTYRVIGMNAANIGIMRPWRGDLDTSVPYDVPSVR